HLTHPALNSFPTRRSSDLSSDGKCARSTTGRQQSTTEFTETTEPLFKEFSVISVFSVVILVASPLISASASCRAAIMPSPSRSRSEEHTSELQSLAYLVCC